MVHTVSDIHHFQIIVEKRNMGIHKDNLLAGLSEYSRLFPKISSYTGNFYKLKLPRIVVIGDQSSGKTSTVVV